MNRRNLFQAALVGGVIKLFPNSEFKKIDLRLTFEIQSEDGTTYIGSSSTKTFFEEVHRKLLEGKSCRWRYRATINGKQSPFMPWISSDIYLKNMFA